MLATRDVEYCRGVDLLRALEDGLIDADEFTALLDRARAELAHAGLEDLNLKGTHVMLSMNPQGHLIRQESGTGPALFQLQLPANQIGPDNSMVISRYTLQSVAQEG